MGMFDSIILPFKCPFCGFEQTKPEEYEDGVWQTKATERLLDVYKNGDALDFGRNLNVKEGEIEIHTICPGCEKFVSATVKIEEGKLTDKIIYQSE